MHTKTGAASERAASPESESSVTQSVADPSIRCKTPMNAIQNLTTVKDAGSSNPDSAHRSTGPVRLRGLRELQY